MKMRIWIAVALAGLVLGSAALGFAATYYIDDNSNVGDVYTPGFTGNDANNGLSPAAPKLTLDNLLSSTNLLPGDVVLIDTGTYTANVVIGANVVGAAGNRIVFQGSTNFAAGGTVFTNASGNIIEIRGSHLHFRDIMTSGGTRGINLIASKFCVFEGIKVIGASAIAINLDGASDSNNFNRCVFFANQFSAFTANNPAKGNYIENCVSISGNSAAFSAFSGSVSNIVGCIGIGRWGIGSMAFTPDGGSRNIFFPSERFHFDLDTLADVQRIYTNWTGNTVADPKFVNAAGLDFHLLSAAGFVSNGVWVTNAAVGYSPAIDFGARE